MKKLEEAKEKKEETPKFIQTFTMPRSGTLHFTPDEISKFVGKRVMLTLERIEE